MRIAFLEDEEEQAERMKALMQQSGYRVHVFNRGRPLLRSLRTETFDLVVLDWELPDVSGLQVLQAMRTRLKLATPVLFLTHRDEEEDIVQALQAGADDFLVKPARERELLARLDALSRRGREASEQDVIADVPPFRIDLRNRQVQRDGKLCELTPREFEVAALLFKNLGQVLSRGHIMESIWGHGNTGSTRTVDMHVSRVRQVLGLSSSIGVRLTSVYGYGYRLERTYPPAAPSTRHEQ